VPHEIASIPEGNRSEVVFPVTTDGSGHAAPQVSEVLDAGLYPDLVESGGLAPALRAGAADAHIDLGEIETEPLTGRFNSAAIGSGRGTIRILLGAEVRKFSISIGGDVHLWASGGTADLDAVVSTAEAWRGGVTLDELVARFPFMSTSALARGYERGDPVGVQWSLLLGDDGLAEVRELLRAVHSNDRLRKLMPYVSHGTLRLANDPWDRAMGEVWISPLPSGTYRVLSTGSSESRKQVGSLEEALEPLLSYLP
jgi:hypothetical protein